MSPVRLYLFLSILFFFIARISTHQTTSSIDSSSLSNALDSASVVTSGDSIVLDQFLSDSLDLQYMGDTTAEDTIETAREKKIREGIQATLDDPDQFMDEILEIISYALFLLMPLFAAILMLLYIRRKRYYIEHLLFALNMHSFALLILTVMVGLQLIFRVQNGFVAWFALVIPVYFIIGMKRFYAQGIPKVLLKAVLLAMIYGLLLFVTLVLILFMAMFWV